MQVSVKLVVFEHPDPTRWDKYCSYCPELKCFFGRGKTVDECVSIVRDKYLLWNLKFRNQYSNLKDFGWVINENSIIVPKFTDEQAVELTERSYGCRIPKYQIIIINVTVPTITE